MTWIVELLLPLRDPQGRPFPAGVFAALQDGLTGRFGGVTAYLRSPARGRWQEDGETEVDDVVLFEVMTPELDRTWWGELRAQLEELLRQKEIVMRAHGVEKL